MARRTIDLQPRRIPRQRRSRQMQEDILTAAARVLRRDGVLRFNTDRVAEAAGISIGSLYQYFPNKQSLVFALHSRTVDLAWVEVRAILDHRRWSAREKVQRIARFFFLAESQDQAEMGAALAESEIFFAEQPAQIAIRGQVTRRFAGFLRAALPRASAGRVKFSTEILILVLESVGRAVASRRLSRREVERFADECAGMLCDRLGL
jgi:AcrR family transcriptional regulator